MAQSQAEPADGGRGKPAAAKAAAAPAKSAEPDAPVPDARALVLRYIGLLRARSSVLLDADAEEQRLQTLHTALQAACPQYASGCVLPPLPTPSDMTADALGLAPGSVCVQWLAPQVSTAARATPRPRTLPAFPLLSCLRTCATT